MRIVNKIIVVVIMLICFGGQVFANENSEWKFFVNGKDSFDNNDNIKSITLAQTCNPNTLVNKKIAPGTEGEFSIIVGVEKLGTEYEIRFENFSSEFPKNLKFEVDGSEYNLDTGFKNKIEDSGTVIHTVNWYWDYDEVDEYFENESTDINFDIVVEATQINEEKRTVLPKTGF